MSLREIPNQVGDLEASREVYQAGQSSIAHLSRDCVQLRGTKTVACRKAGWLWTDVRICKDCIRELQEGDRDE